MWKLILLFTLLPFVELTLLLTMGSQLGVVPTLLLVLFTGVAGGFMAKREGLSVLRQLSESVQQGIPPANKIAEGGLVVAGGLLLLTPGVLTDIAGFAFIIGPTRRAIAPYVLRWVIRRFPGTNPANAANQAAANRKASAANSTAAKGDGGPDLSRHFDHPVH